jgi:hypothetical protein
LLFALLRITLLASHDITFVHGAPIINFATIVGRFVPLYATAVYGHLGVSIAENTVAKQ